MSAPSYDSYKESGVEWLGKVPSHWQIVPFWSLYRRTKRTGFPDADLLSVYRDYGVIRKSDRDDNFNNPSDDLSTYQLVEPGDLAMNKMKAWQGSLGVSAHRGIVSPAYFVFQAHHADNRQFLHYLLRSRGYAVGFMSISKGIRIGQWDIDPDHLRRVPVPLPSLAEQAAIAAFLDRETGKIDALVEAQTRLIELLREKRQAVISHAVTKGLEPAAPMKDSGVEWLGQVPAHWEVKRLRFVSDIGTGDGDTVDAEDDGEFAFYVRSPIIQRIGRFTHDCEAVLTSGDGAGVGKIFHYVRGKFSAHQRVYIFNHFRGINAKFFFHYLRENFFKVALEGGAKSTVDSLRRPLIANFWMTVPPAEEQEAIVSKVELLSERFDGLTREAEAAITLLQERRAALISAAVTGKIDVRGLAAEQAKAA
nr:restriction endonuclease subunit S [Brevundimonas naejangsanensis]